MKTPRHRRSSVSTGTVLASVLLLSLTLADSASALDPRPRTYRERAKHDFRDVQLGLCHPADGTGESKSVKCSEAHQKLQLKESYNK